VGSIHCLKSKTNNSSVKCSAQLAWQMLRNSQPLQRHTYLTIKAILIDLKVNLRKGPFIFSNKDQMVTRGYTSSTNLSDQVLYGFH
jgi:hypothetical protein